VDGETPRSPPADGYRTRPSRSLTFFPATVKQAGKKIYQAVMRVMVQIESVRLLAQQRPGRALSLPPGQNPDR